LAWWSGAVEVDVCGGKGALLEIRVVGEAMVVIEYVLPGSSVGVRCENVPGRYVKRCKCMCYGVHARAICAEGEGVGGVCGRMMFEVGGGCWGEPCPASEEVAWTRDRGGLALLGGRCGDAERGCMW
jgi:hypothetical protein